MKSVFEHQSIAVGKNFTVKEYNQKFFTSPFHFHNLYEFIFIVKGFGQLYAGNSIIDFNQGEIFLFGPGLPHCFYNKETFRETNSWGNAIVIFFKEDFLSEELLENNEFFLIKKLFQESSLGIKMKKSNEKFKNMFSGILEKKGMDALITLLKLLNNFSKQDNKIKLLNFHHPKKHIDDADSNRLDPVLKYIFNNFKGRLTLKEAASIACLNETSFCRYFKSRTDETFSQFVNRVRITHATQLLAKEEKSISDICYNCGYQNMSYFNRQFKKIIGKSPSDYRTYIITLPYK